MDMLQTAWVAGYLEGEGCFTSNSQNGKKYARCQAMSIDYDILRLLQDAAGGIVNGPYTRPGRQKFWRWGLNGDAAIVLMLDIYDYMSKRRQHQILTALMHYRRQAAAFGSSP